MMRLIPPILLLALGLHLAGCEKALEAPNQPGICYAMAVAPNGTVKFNPLARDQPDLEHCGAELDIMRLRFLGLGSNSKTVTGAYQGQFLFVGPEGVYTASSYKGFRYLMLVHSGDGRLVTPGSLSSQ